MSCHYLPALIPLPPSLFVFVFSVVVVVDFFFFFFALLILRLAAQNNPLVSLNTDNAIRQTTTFQRQRYFSPLLVLDFSDCSVLRARARTLPADLSSLRRRSLACSFGADLRAKPIFSICAHLSNPIVSCRRRRYSRFSWLRSEHFLPGARLFEAAPAYMRACVTKRRSRRHRRLNKSRASLFRARLCSRLPRFSSSHDAGSSWLSAPPPPSLSSKVRLTAAAPARNTIQELLDFGRSLIT